MIARYIARQFSRPTGLLGRVIGRGMARHNEREARWTVDLLAIEPDAPVLEISFGPGGPVHSRREMKQTAASSDDSEPGTLRSLGRIVCSLIVRVRRRLPSSVLVRRL